MSEQLGTCDQTKRILHSRLPDDEQCSNWIEWRPVPAAPQPSPAGEPPMVVSGRPCIKSEAYGVSAEVCGCPKCRVTPPLLAPVGEPHEKVMTNAEWSSLSAESRHKLNLLFAAPPPPASETARELVAKWREGERNSPYGLDENGTRIPMRDGNQCADELESALIERGTQGTESQGVDADAGFPPTPDPASGKEGERK